MIGMDEEEGAVRSKTLPLPRTKEQLLELLKRVLDLSELREITVTEQSVTVSRRVPGNAPVVPPTDDDETVDGEFALHHLADNLDEYPFAPEEHPLFILRDVMARITNRGLRPNWVLAPAGGWLEAYLGLPEEPPATHVFGMRVVLLRDQKYGKLVVVGSPTNYLSDASYGVIVEMGA